MNIIGFLKRNLALLFFISLVYFIYSFFVLQPQKYRYFSLVDDGQVILQSSAYFEDCVRHFECKTFIDQTMEFGSSRFRPSYWLINNINFEIFGKNANSHHLYRVYVVGYVSVLCFSLILLQLKVRRDLIFLFSVLFFTTYSFSENIIRLGTNEPYQIIFLSLFSLIYLGIKKFEKISNGKYLLLLSILVFAILIKENNIAVLPGIVLVDFALSKRISAKKFLTAVISGLVVVLGIYLSKKMPSVISGDLPLYASNYTFSPEKVIQNSLNISQLLFNTLSPFLKLGIIFAPLVYFFGDRKILTDKKFLYWTIFSVSFVLFLVPWKYVLDRYHLVGIFGLLIVLSVIFDKFINQIQTNFFSKFFPMRFSNQIYNFLIFVFMLNLYFSGAPVNLAKTINYREWFSTFTLFEGEQVLAIKKYNQEDRVFLNAVNNINDWEFLYEVPIHLKYLYSADPNLEIINSNSKNIKYIFSRSSLDSYYGHKSIEKYGYKLIEMKNYSIEQIDPLRFRQEFTKKPFHTWIKPPYTNNPYVYEWGIYVNVQQI